MSAYRPRAYKLTLQTLTPIHIGDGEELRHGFDFVIKGNRTWRLNEDAILDAKWKAMGLDQPGRRRYPLPGEVLTERDFENRHLFRYVMRGAPRSRRADARLKTFIKDYEDRPYIPGSSLKGALRTALAWTGWNEINPRLDRRAIGNRRSWAGQPLERKLFGKDPNHDLLRALQVSDLHGDLNPSEALAVVNAQVLTRGSLQSPIELEALLPNRTLIGTVTIEDYLFSPQAERELRLGRRKRWLDDLMVRVQEHSKARLEKRLLPWFEGVKSAEKVANFYRQLYDLNLASNQALVQIGWGSGWDGKTFWTHLQEDEYLFEKLMRDFRLQHRRGRNAAPSKAKDFPISRRVVVSKGRIAAPFGWAVLTLEENR